MLSYMIHIIIILAYVALAYNIYPKKLFTKQHMYMYIISLVGLFAFHYPLHSCEHIGHEALYFEISQGIQSLQPPDTLHYPTQQILWWFLQLPVRFLPEGLGPLLVSAGIPVLFSKLFSHSHNTNWKGFLWVVTLPAFLDWGCSYYNVLPPVLFALLFLLGIQRSYRYITLFSGFLLLGSRIEWIVVLPFIFLGSFSKKETTILTIVLSFWWMFLIWIFDQEIPGSGERWQAFFTNISLTNYLDIYSHLGFAWVIFAIFLHQRLPKKQIAGLLIWCFSVHIFMSTFNDYGFRHVFPIWLGIGYIIVHSKTVWIPVICAHLFTAIQHYQLHYADEMAWAKYTQELSIPNTLLTLSLQEVQDIGCARIAESDIFQQEPVLSHFNLYNVSEYQDLQQEHGCVQWCLEFNQWRWTSLGVSDRNHRINNMYHTKILGLIKEKEQSCVLYDVYQTN